MARKPKAKTEDAGGAPAPAPVPAPAPKAPAASRRLLALGEIVAAAMRSPAHRGLTLAEVERRFVPAIARGQFAIGHGQIVERPGDGFPAAAVAYALVSPEVAARLARGDTALDANDWRSGAEPWIVETIGAEAAVAELVAALDARMKPGATLKRVPPAPISRTKP